MKRKCVACGNCVPICPMGAIHIDPVKRRATVNQDECVECYTCYRGMSKEHLNPVMVRTIRKIGGFLRWRFDPEPDVCPTDALTEPELSWPRVVRRAFSDPVVPHESTGVHGRGTEEVKTNDVTNRVGPGDAGFTIEFGRPTVGVRFWQIQEMTRELAKMDLTFEKRNPVTSLMANTSTGDLREDILEREDPFSDRGVQNVDSQCAGHSAQGEGSGKSPGHRRGHRRRDTVRREWGQRPGRDPAPGRISLCTRQD